ncbi:HAMP domain-containing sensor histidine kinase [Emcibacter sp.]|uniref:sensor histidine kinase n=1 Tax=Emcibacter sp. TaxID=1979954 RepID=UPI002AA814AB|nr:HAMP domain-containing sensor histidine kinase [Emcibacter sp.]
MQQYWHPYLFLFLAVASVPVAILLRRSPLARLSKGYLFFIAGTVSNSFAALILYLEKIPAGQQLFIFLTGQTWHANSSLPYLAYAPGLLAITCGLYFWLPAVNDITREIEQRRNVEEELVSLYRHSEQLAVKAEEANQAKSDFLATMSHELRTPLNAVIGYAEFMLLHDIPLDEARQKDYIQAIRKSGLHLLDLINDILDLAKVEAGKIELTASEFHVGCMMEECRDFIETIALKQDIGVEINAENIPFRTDVRILRQIVINLLANAIKYNLPGGRVGAEAKLVGDQLEITVKDNGIGMSPQELKKVMEPFMQVDNSYSRSAEGTGLGLTLVSQFTCLLKGNIELRSEKHIGTTAIVRIPQLQG